MSSTDRLRRRNDRERLLHLLASEQAVESTDDMNVQQAEGKEEVGGA